MELTVILRWVKNHYKLLCNTILGLITAFSLSFGIINHNKAKRLSDELKIANNNIEAYLESIDETLLASTVLKLDMNKLKDYNDKLIRLIDSIGNEQGVKSKEILAAATLKQIINVNKSKGVGGDIITIIKDSTYSDSLQYNPLTKVFYTIGKDSVNIRLDVENTQYLIIYKHKEYKNKKNFFKRLITFDWKKEYKYRYKIHNSNDVIKEDSLRVIEAI